MKRPAPGEARAEGGTRDSLATEQEVPSLDEFIRGPRPRTPRLLLAWLYGRWAKSIRDNEAACVHEFEHLLRQAMQLAESGALFGSVEDRARFVDLARRALRGDATAYGKLERYFIERPHMRLQVRARYSREVQANGG